MAAPEEAPVSSGRGWAPQDDFPAVLQLLCSLQAPPARGLAI